MKIFWSEMRRLRHAVLYLYYVLQMYCCWRTCDDDHVTQIITNKKKLKPKTITTFAVLCQPCHSVVKHGFFHCIYTRFHVYGHAHAYATRKNNALI